MEPTINAIVTLKRLLPRVLLAGKLAREFGSKNRTRVRAASEWFAETRMHGAYAREKGNSLARVRPYQHWSMTYKERYGYLRVPSLMTRKFSSSYRCASCSYWNKVLSG